MDTPIPHFLFMDLYSYLFYPFIIFSHFFSFLIHFSYALVTMPLLKAFCTSLEGVFSYFLVHGQLCRWQGYIQNVLCIQCIIILALHDSSCLWVEG